MLPHGLSLQRTKQSYCISMYYILVLPVTNTNLHTKCLFTVSLLILALYNT